MMHALYYTSGKSTKVKKERGIIDSSIAELIRDANRLDHLDGCQKQHMLECAVTTIRDMRETNGMPSGPGRDSLLDLHNVALSIGRGWRSDEEIRNALLQAAAMIRDLHIILDSKTESASSNLPDQLRQRRVIAMIPVSRPSSLWPRSLPERCRLLHALASLNRRAGPRTKPADPCRTILRSSRAAAGTVACPLSVTVLVIPSGPLHRRRTSAGGIRWMYERFSRSGGDSGFETRGTGGRYAG